jgi:tight adherence protein B
MMVAIWFGYGLMATALIALLLALDAWVRVKDSLPQRVWQAYKAWYKEHADYLIERMPARAFALRHAQSGAAGLVLGAFTEQPMLIVGGLLCGLLFPVFHLRQRVRKRREELQRQIDPALQFIANALQVTPSLEEALMLVSQHLRPPMSEEVTRVVSCYRLGQSMDDALQGMAERCNDAFITAMVIALVVGRRTGGNIAVTLRRIAVSTREAVRVELELSSKTRGQRNQFFLIALLYPLGLIGIKTGLPFAWENLMNSYFGKVALFVSMAMVGAAIIWALKILSPKNL